MVRLSWKILGDGSLPPRFDHGLAAVESWVVGAPPQVFCIGGMGMPLQNPSLDTQVLNESRTSWTSCTTSCIPSDEALPGGGPPARGSHACAASGKTIVVFGGASISEARAIDDLYLLDVDKLRWTVPVRALGSTPMPRTAFTATAVGSKVLFIGGLDSRGPLNDVYIFDVTAHKWTKPVVLGTPPTPRCAHTAVLVGPYLVQEEPDARDCNQAKGDRILVYGGSSRGFDDDGNQRWKAEGDIWLLEVETPFIKEQRAKLGREVVAWSQGIVGDEGVLKAPRPVVICGPSGVGKGTLINKLMEEYPKTCGFSVSHTTRLPRPGEVDGLHYHFTNKETMEAEIAGGKFLEYANVHGNLYGTSVAAVEYVLASGKTCILDIDVQGAESVRKSSLKALFIFIAPPSYEALEQRLRGRATETEPAIQKRLRNAQRELDRSKEPGLFDHVLVNDNLDECYEKLKRILYLGPKPSRSSQGDVARKSQTDSKGTAQPVANGSDNRTSSSDDLGLFRLPSIKTKLPQPAPEDVLPPSCRSGHSAVVVDQKMLVYGGVTEQLKPLSDVHCLDVSELSGGAPMQTRGLKWLPVEMEPVNGTKPLSSLVHHRGVAMSDKDALFVGGFDGQEAVGQSVVLSLL